MNKQIFLGFYNQGQLWVWGGMFLTIVGDGSTLGVSLSEFIAQSQGVTVYHPTRIIRSLDIFVAMANLSEIVAHLVGMVAALSLAKWLHEQM